PQGTYTFTVAVTLPATMAQPNAPHVSNFTAGQTVSSSQPFTLTWDPFTGGTATDYVFVQVGNVWKTPTPGTTGALNGTATSVTIPAGTLQPGSTNDAFIYFYHTIITSNAAYLTEAFRSSATEFSV